MSLTEIVRKANSRIVESFRYAHRNYKTKETYLLKKMEGKDYYEQQLIKNQNMLLNEIEFPFRFLMCLFNPNYRDFEAEILRTPEVMN
ncbi:MAG: hypothetical protein ABIG37_02755 [Nanoarchaeota archaeon]|nr:hypothetical protein [Nanoarchaeota archaeon]